MPPTFMGTNVAPALDVASVVYSSTEVREPLAKRTQLRASEVQLLLGNLSN